MTTVVEVRPAGERPDLLVARDDALVRERPDGDGGDGGDDGNRVFVCDEGPFRDYRRTVRTLDDGQVEVRADFTVRPVFWGWLFIPGMRARLTKLPSGSPWWAPPQRVDRRGAEVIGLLCSISVVAGFLGTVITQTATFAADEFGASTAEQSRLLAGVRASIVIIFVLAVLIDRMGRRRLVTLTAVAGCLVTATGALAPGLIGLGVSQAVARGFSGTLSLLILIISAEEMPGGSRAWAYSVVSLCQALGAGMCLWVLPVADIGGDGSAWWRVVYLVPLLFLPIVAVVHRHLPESRRFAVPHVEAPIAGHGRRFGLLAVTLFFLALFATPASQLGNDFLKEHRGFQASGITIFTLATATPAFIGVVVGGRLADTHGRRIVGAVAVSSGTILSVVAFSSTGAALWFWTLLQNIFAAGTIPALGVYRPELFPTSLRGRAAGALEAPALAGAVAGLLIVGALVDGGWTYGSAFAVLAPGPLFIAVLVLIAFPETARRTLEDINPEDRTPVLARGSLTVRPTRRLAVLAVVASLASLAGCGDGYGDDTDTTDTSGAATAGESTTSIADDGEVVPLDSLTEGNVAGLQAAFGDALAPLDLVVTRGGMTEFRGGNHLQLYVEPTTGEAENGPQVYLDRIMGSYLALLPLLFDRYPELDSFDVCQEVVPAADAGPAGYEEPVTLLLITREGFETVDDWSSATLTDLFRATSEDLGGNLYAESPVASLPDYVGAAQEANLDG